MGYKMVDEKGMDVEYVQKILRPAVKELLKKEPESILSIEKSEDGWKVQVEVLERRAIPDKFDLLKIFEFSLNEKGKVLGFKQTKRIQRGDLE